MINKEKHHVLKERRSHLDRRQDASSNIFPIKLSCGTTVKRDRRFIPERRLRKISVSELELKTSEFKKLFGKFS